MKPHHLASPHLAFPPHLDQVREAHRNEPGEIDSDSVSSWNAEPFYAHLRQCGYRDRQCNQYPSLSLTFVNGACRWHDDPGFGLVACWLIYTEVSRDDAPQLVTKHGPLDLYRGDLCVFDANQGHAWLSNGACVMLMATITKLRSSAAS